ncbi:MAG: YqgE/AlgH family protein [Deltaproteobacteria bacterium]|nr:YqgE/AlgH family protein [Deltaproteobacteria bacterium]
MEDKQPGSLQGQFLTSMPSLMDPNFYQTVTCICEYAQAGTVGIVVNRVHPSLSGKDIFEELGIAYEPGAESIPIHLGGPVHIGEIFVLHGPPFDWEGCLRITSSLAMGNTKDLLSAIAMGKGPKSYIITLGCAGWASGQLEAEIRENAWLICPVYEDIVFHVPVEARWEETMNKMGIDPAKLFDTAGHA